MFIYIIYLHVHIYIYTHTFLPIFMYRYFYHIPLFFENGSIFSHQFFYKCVWYSITRTIANLKKLYSLKTSARAHFFWGSQLGLILVMFLISWRLFNPVQDAYKCFFTMPFWGIFGLLCGIFFCFLRIVCFAHILFRFCWFSDWKTFCWCSPFLGATCSSISWKWLNIFSWHFV